MFVDVCSIIVLDLFPLRLFVLPFSRIICLLYSVVSGR
jgi:hypothetical protein